MIERVARAVVKESAPWLTESEIDAIDRDEGLWPACIETARTAIKAMREPTEPMVEAAWEHTSDPCWRENVADAWRAAIDAALSE